MEVRVSKLAKEMSCSVTEIVRMIQELGYSCENNPNCKVPEDVANAIRGDRVDIDKLLASELQQKRDANKKDCVTFTYNVNPFEASAIKSDGTTSNRKISRGFVLEELLLDSFGELQKIKLANTTPEDTSAYYSILIGINGVGKSRILREVVDFIVDLQSSVVSETNGVVHSKPGKLRGIRYQSGGDFYEVVRLKHRYLALSNGRPVSLAKLPLPSIVACHFGAFEKLPVPKVNGSAKSKYDVPYYKYVGAHVNGGIISSSAIMFRLLFTLNQAMDESQSAKVKSMLDYIGYDHRISLHYSLVIKSRKNGDVRDAIHNSINNDKEFSLLSKSQRSDKERVLYSFYNNKLLSGQKEHCFHLDFDNSSGCPNEDLYWIYKLKQYDCIASSKIVFRKRGLDISSEEMSSGELIMLAMVLSISAASKPNSLILVDEPEMGQHPNWQMSIVEKLEEALKGQNCHVIIATHSHLLVSDLPINRSSVIQMDRNEGGGLNVSCLLANTHGWSAEEILLKVFKTATDRNRYFGEMIGKTLERIGNGDIENEDVKKELAYLERVSMHLSDADPMKMVLKTIIQEYFKS